MGAYPGSESRRDFAHPTPSQRHTMQRRPLFTFRVYTPLSKLAGWRNTEPQGELIGWVDSEAIYVLPTRTLELVNESLRKAGNPLNLRRAALFRQLIDKGLAADKQGDRNTHVVTVNGKSKQVWTIHLPALGG